jgi:GTP-binding protein LepA
MDPKYIRNFSIIAHIDHGKSTLADRMLEITGTIEARKMHDQVLDTMELEKERGITIKMTPVRMEYLHDKTAHILNLIDTPGHIDFAYEVSRALRAVEGSVLLVDATQGVQAQTLTTLAMAREAGLVIIPAISKVDSPLARIDETKLEIAGILDIDPDTVLEVSGKTGQGVDILLQEIINRIPPPKESTGKGLQALVFDFKYDDHRGVIVYSRLFSGTAMRHDNIRFSASNEQFQALEVGTFSPAETAKPKLSAGEIGYIVTGVKRPGVASVGDTLVSPRDSLPPLAGYMQPRPVVWASVYPESQDDFPALKLALGRLRLSDSSLSFEEENSGSLGRGYRCGFLGMLHLEIISERLRREFSLELITTTPSITYEVDLTNGKREIIYSPHLFPNDGSVKQVYEPWATIQVITPQSYLATLMPLFFEHEAEVGETENFGEGRTAIHVLMPLREMMRNFFDELKSATSGYASISYDIGELRKADVTRLDILVADEVVPAFSRVVSKKRLQEEAETSVEKLHAILPRQMFETKVQGVANGRILSSRTIKAFRKDVTGYLYGGDYTRKMKLLEKQKKGKKKMKARGTVNIPHDVFLKMMQGGKGE